MPFMISSTSKLSIILKPGIRVFETLDDNLPIMAQFAMT